MTNKNFYAFCRDKRKTEPNEQRRAALQDVYKYMWECGVTKAGVAQYISHRMDELSRQGKPFDAYRWLLGVFTRQEVA